METAFILVVVALSSAAAAVVVMRGRPHRGLGPAVAKALETAGLVAVFLILNLVLGFSLALFLRAGGGGFVSLYVNDDIAILLLSALQALVFQWWREPDREKPPRR